MGAVINEAGSNNRVRYEQDETICRVSVEDIAVIATTHIAFTFGKPQEKLVV